MSLVRAISSVLTGVLWYSTGKKLWVLCYPKVHANRVHVIRHHLCIKDFQPGQTFIHLIRASELRQSVLTKFYSNMRYEHKLT